MSKRAAHQETKQTQNPEKKDHPRASSPVPPLSSTLLKIAGRVNPLITDPSLATLKLTQSANASSLPLNHFDTIAL